MKLLKRLLKIIFLIIVIFLASLGIGLTGAAPLNLNSRGRDNKNEAKIELLEEKDEDVDAPIIKEIY